MDLQIIKIASDNKNQKILKKYTHDIKNKNSICGDEITIKLLVNNKIIKEIGYDCKSCVFCQASVNLLSKKIVNMNSDKAFDLCNDAINFYKSKDNKMIKSLSFFKKIIFFVFLIDLIHYYLHYVSRCLRQKLNLQHKFGYVINFL